VRLHEPAATGAVLPHRAGHLLKRVVFRTDEVMVLAGVFRGRIPSVRACPTPGLPDLGDKLVEDGLRARSAPDETAQLCRRLQRSNFLIGAASGRAGERARIHVWAGVVSKPHLRPQPKSSTVEV
jgi:hypothetical protein